MSHLCYKFLRLQFIRRRSGLFLLHKAGQQRLLMNNDLYATIVVHFIVKTWIKQEFHAMNKTFPLTSQFTSYKNHPEKHACLNYNTKSSSRSVIKRKKTSIWYWCTTRMSMNIHSITRKVKSAKSVAGEKIACSICIYLNETNKVPRTTNCLRESCIAY